MWERLLILIIGILLGAYQIWAYKDKDDKGPEMTGHATVKSRRVDQGRFHGKATGRWNYLVTFTLSDGEEIELYTHEEHFRALKEGTSGQLTWQGKQFLEFDTDE